MTGFQSLSKSISAKRWKKLLGNMSRCFFANHSCINAFGFDLDFARKMHKYNTIDNDIDFAKMIDKTIFHKYLTT